MAKEAKPEPEVIDLDDLYYDYEDQILQLAIFASLGHSNSSSSPPPPFINLTNDDDDDDFNIHPLNPEKFHPHSIREIGESSSSSHPTKSPVSKPPKPFVCQICFDEKPVSESFTIKGCTHEYCKECVSNHVAAKLQDNATHIACPSPDCQVALELNNCIEILPRDVFECWGKLLCESMISAAEKFYCPFKDCSALFINDAGDGDGGIKESECPNCHRLFCVQCKSSWHFGMECSEYKKLGKGENETEDIMLMNLAKDKKWKRCLKCRIFVEKSVGCNYMKCRCGFAFCYNCGAANTSLNHLCPKCGH